MSPPYAQIAKEKFNMNILETSTDKFASIQNGAAVHVKTLQERPGNPSCPFAWSPML